jgi:hypothetical protein
VCQVDCFIHTQVSLFAYKTDYLYPVCSHLFYTGEVRSALSGSVLSVCVGGMPFYVGGLSLYAGGLCCFSKTLHIFKTVHLW